MKPREQGKWFFLLFVALSYVNSEYSKSHDQESIRFTRKLQEPQKIQDENISRKIHTKSVQVHSRPLTSFNKRSETVNLEIGEAGPSRSDRNVPKRNVFNIGKKSICLEDQRLNIRNVKVARSFISSKENALSSRHIYQNNRLMAEFLNNMNHERNSVFQSVRKFRRNILFEPNLANRKHFMELETTNRADNIRTSRFDMANPEGIVNRNVNLKGNIMRFKNHGAKKLDRKYANINQYNLLNLKRNTFQNIRMQQNKNTFRQINLNGEINYISAKEQLHRTVLNKRRVARKISKEGLSQSKHKFSSTERQIFMESISKETPVILTIRLNVHNRGISIRSQERSKLANKRENETREVIKELVRKSRHTRMAIQDRRQERITLKPEIRRGYRVMVIEKMPAKNQSEKYTRNPSVGHVDLLKVNNIRIRITRNFEQRLNKNRNQNVSMSNRSDIRESEDYRIIYGNKLENSKIKFIDYSKLHELNKESIHNERATKTMKDRFVNNAKRRFVLKERNIRVRNELRTEQRESDGGLEIRQIRNSELRKVRKETVYTRRTESNYKLKLDEESRKSKLSFSGRNDKGDNGVGKFYNTLDKNFRMQSRKNEIHPKMYLQIMQENNERRTRNSRSITEDREHRRFALSDRINQISRNSEKIRTRLPQSRGAKHVTERNGRGFRGKLIYKMLSDNNSGLLSRENIESQIKSRENTHQSRTERNNKRICENRLGVLKERNGRGSREKHNSDKIRSEDFGMQLASRIHSFEIENRRNTKDHVLRLNTKQERMTEIEKSRTTKRGKRDIRRKRHTYERESAKMSDVELVENAELHDRVRKIEQLTRKEGNYGSKLKKTNENRIVSNKTNGRQLRETQKTYETPESENLKMQIATNMESHEEMVKIHRQDRTERNQNQRFRDSGENCIMLNERNGRGFRGKRHTYERKVSENSRKQTTQESRERNAEINREKRKDRNHNRRFRDSEENRIILNWRSDREFRSKHNTRDKPARESSKSHLASNIESHEKGRQIIRQTRMEINYNRRTRNFNENRLILNEKNGSRFRGKRNTNARKVVVNSRRQITEEFLEIITEKYHQEKAEKIQNRRCSASKENRMALNEKYGRGFHGKRNTHETASSKNSKNQFARNIKSRENDKDVTYIIGTEISHNLIFRDSEENRIMLNLRNSRRFQGKRNTNEKKEDNSRRQLTRESRERNAKISSRERAEITYNRRFRDSDDYRMTLNERNGRRFQRKRNTYERTTDSENSNRQFSRNLKSREMEREVTRQKSTDISHNRTARDSDENRIMLNEKNRRGFRGKRNPNERKVSENSRKQINRESRERTSEITHQERAERNHNRRVRDSEENRMILNKRKDRGFNGKLNTYERTANRNSKRHLVTNIESREKEKEIIHERRTEISNNQRFRNSKENRITLNEGNDRGFSEKRNTNERNVRENSRRQLIRESQERSMQITIKKRAEKNQNHRISDSEGNRMALNKRNGRGFRGRLNTYESTDRENYKRQFARNIQSREIEREITGQTRRETCHNRRAREYDENRIMLNERNGRGFHGKHNSNERKVTPENSKRQITKVSVKRYIEIIVQARTERNNRIQRKGNSNICNEQIMAPSDNSINKTFKMQNQKNKRETERVFSLSPSSSSTSYNIHRSLKETQTTYPPTRNFRTEDAIEFLQTGSNFKKFSGQAKDTRQRAAFDHKVRENGILQRYSALTSASQPTHRVLNKDQPHSSVPVYTSQETFDEAQGYIKTSERHIASFIFNVILGLLIIVAAADGKDSEKTKQWNWKERFSKAMLMRLNTF